MLTYVLLTYILLAIGWLLYNLFVTKFVGYQGRKIFLLAAALCSLVIPSFFTKYELKRSITTTPQFNCNYDVLAEFCPKEEILEACFSLALTEKNFCHCQHISKENIIVYDDNKFFDFLVWQEHSLQNLLLIGSALILLALLFQILYLQSLIYTGKKQKISIGGKDYTLLYHNKYQKIGSFRFFGQYIVWNEELDALSTPDKHAILWHEIAHIEQKDTWLRFIINALQPVWLFHPLYYFIKNELNELSEFIADKVAMVRSGESPKEYAGLILRMATVESRSSHNKTSMIHNFSGQDLKRRISNILNKNNDQRSTKMLLVAMGALLVSYTFISYEISPILQWQIDKLEIYEVLSEENHQHGKTIFCKECLTRKLLQ